MASILAIKKSFELSANPAIKMLVSRQTRELSSTADANVAAMKKHFDYMVSVAFDSDGGTPCAAQSYALGQTYGELPVPQKDFSQFDGWFDANGAAVLSSDFVQLSCTSLTAHWEEIDFGEDYTEYVVSCNATYKKTGIYQAARADSSKPIYIDWGDGALEQVNGNLSQKSHQYASAGVYRVKISDNITTFAPNSSNYTWYQTTSQNKRTLVDVVKTSSRITTMAAYAFYSTALSSIGFLSSCWTSLTAIPSYAFQYCENLKTLSSLPSRIKTLGTYAFANCIGLTGTQDLRNTGLTSLYNSYTFYYCNHVTEWKLPSTLTGTALGQNIFSNNTQLTAIDLPSALTALPLYGFSGCQSLQTLTVPQNVTRINSYCFGNCGSLTGLSYETTALTSIGDNAFAACTSLDTLNIPSTVTTIENYAFTNCGFTSLEVPSSVISFGQYVFSDCYSLEAVSFEDENLAEVPYGMFCNCGNLYDVTIPDTVEYISDQAFANCGCLTSLVLPTSLTGIGQGTFNNTGFEDIAVPSSVTYIGPEAFSGCPYLTAITLPDDLQMIDYGTFTGCYMLQSISIPSAVTYIGYDAFNGCESLTEIELPAGLETIESTTFAYCTSLGQIAIPSAVTYIGSGAFMGCTWLSQISAYPMTAPYAEWDAFGSYYDEYGNYDEETGEYTEYSDYTGWNTRGSNVLYTYALATGYDEGSWQDTLQNADFCDFQADYLDPWNIQWCTITLSAMDGYLDPGQETLSCVQGRKLSMLPKPACPPDYPKFTGWFDQPNGEGTKYTKNDYAPEQSALTLYAYYTEMPEGTWPVDLGNDDWVTFDDIGKYNPDDSIYDGYVSDSNWHVNDGISKMYIYIDGVTDFTLYIQSDAESVYDFVAVGDLDVDIDLAGWGVGTYDIYADPGSYGIVATTANENGQQTGDEIEYYTEVTFSDIDGGPHTICVAYMKDGGVDEGEDRGYVLVPRQAQP